MLAVGAPGDPRLPDLGDGIDVRNDLPAYWVHRDGVRAETVSNISDVWQDDHVAVDHHAQMPGQHQAGHQSELELSAYEKGRMAGELEAVRRLEAEGALGQKSMTLQDNNSNVHKNINNTNITNINNFAAVTHI